MKELPKIIQGGMGAGVSNWKLAQAVSSLGQLGVVSGTAIDQILIRRLQDGDPEGHMRRALNAFPIPAIAEDILNTFYIPGGRAPSTPYKIAQSTGLYIASNFVEVYLAREGHTNPVGINYLEKIQPPHLPSIYGAMLAGVNTIIMGAGIPIKIPGILDLYVDHQPASYPLQITGGEAETMHFNPADYLKSPANKLFRPHFLAIVSSNTLATTLLKKSNGRVDGFVIETQTAGGHNAPPRGKLQLTESGEPIYGERDAIDIPKLRELGVPFWLAGGYGRPGMLAHALAQGAAGIQVGTAFEFAQESGLHDTYKQALIAKAVAGHAEVFTDPLASPTGFPFTVARLEATASEPEIYAARPRICDLGFLREAYRTPEGTTAYRCAGEPVTLYTSKGGEAADTIGRKCICNGLLANIGQAQTRNGGRTEPPIITAGDDLTQITQFLKPNDSTYSARSVIETLLQPNP